MPMLTKALLPYRQVFAQPAYRWFWLGFSGSVVGDALSRVALTWYVYEQTQSAAALGLTRQHFQALDSTQFATAQGEVPDLVLVNPPRRGIGRELCDYLSRMAPQFIVYSSCNAQSMARDFYLLPGYRLARVQLFDMFPHTSHYEVLTLLIKK